MCVWNSVPHAIVLLMVSVENTDQIDFLSFIGVRINAIGMRARTELFINYCA